VDAHRDGDDGVSRHEARDVAQAARRMVRALVRRAGTGDTEAIRELVETQRMIGEAIVEAGAAAYATGHYSYTDLAGELGISRQAARQRFAGIERRPVGPVVDEAQMTIPVGGE
jgi:hypothetical protein